MKLEQLSKNTSISKKELENLGLEDEGTKIQYAEALKEQLQKIRTDCESLFHPDVGFFTLIENEFLTEVQKLELFKIFKESSKILRDYESARIEAKLIAWIKEFYVFWIEKKEILLGVNKHLAKNWNDKDSDKLMLEYLG